MQSSRMGANLLGVEIGEMGDGYSPRIPIVLIWKKYCLGGFAANIKASTQIVLEFVLPVSIGDR